MKICDITNFYSTHSGGVKTYINRKRRYIESNGKHTHILIVPGEEDETSEDGAGRIYRLEGRVPFWEKNYRFMTDFGKIRSIIAEEHPDVIEMGSPYLVPWAVHRVARKLSIPLVGFYHSNFPEIYVRRLTQKLFGDTLSRWCESRAWGYAKRVYGWCDAVVATSHYVESELEQAGIARVVVIPFGVDTDVFSPEFSQPDLRSRLAIDRDSTLLISTGRLSREKGIDQLLEAFELLNKRGQYELILIGDGPCREEIVERAKNDSRLHIPGYISHEDGLAGYYASADIFVSASQFETFGLSTLEAMACGLPVAAVRAGGTPELIPPNLGEIAEPNSPEALADAIESLHRRLSPGLRRACCEHVKGKYLWSGFYDSLIKLYTSLVEAGSRR